MKLIKSCSLLTVIFLATILTTCGIFDSGSSSSKKYTSGNASSSIETDDTGQEETVATPSFSPSAGIYNSTKFVAILTDTSGAEIYYTLDETDPSCSTSTLYTGALTISSTKTIKAIACKDGMLNSEIAVSAYKISPTTPTCTSDSQCLSSQHCVSGACQNVCPNTPCATGYYCEVATHTCKTSAGQMCVNDGGCSSTQHCINGICTTACPNTACTGGKICDVANHTCINCTTHSQCPSVPGKVPACIGGSCTGVECLNNTNCQAIEPCSSGMTCIGTKYCQLSGRSPYTCSCTSCYGYGHH